MKPLLIDNILTLFGGDSYVQYNLETGHRLTPNARPIADQWHIPFPKIDSAVHWSTDVVYFLNAMQVVRYSLRTNQVDAGFPKIIPFYWRGLWASDINAVLRIDQKAWFFRKNQCIEYSIATNLATSNGAQPIACYWPGLPELITGAVPLPADFVLFFSGEKCYLYNRHQKRIAVGPSPFTDLIQDVTLIILERFRDHTESD